MTNAIKRKIFSITALILLVAGFLMLTRENSSKVTAVILFAMTFVLVLINSIGTIYYSKGTKFLEGAEPDINKALPYLEKALKRTLDPNAAIVAATLLLQYGDMEKGRKILEEYTSAKDMKIQGPAKVSLSMYWWIKKDNEKATGILENVYSNTSYRDRNLYINLLTFYLEEARYREFRKLLKEAKDRKVNNTATLDLEASYFMVQSDWAQCGIYTQKLFASGKPRFMDPYIHAAMVQLHYGEWENAVKTLKDLKENVIFTNSSVYTEAQIDTFIAYIEDKETRWGFLRAIDNDPALIIRREVPSVERGLTMPSFPKMPDFSLPAAAVNDEEGDNGDISTELTDEDEEWLKKHNND